MSSKDSASPDYETLVRELEHYRKRCSELEAENRELKKRLASLETTMHAVVARSIDAKADTPKSRYKKPGRRYGHQGAARA